MRRGDSALLACDPRTLRKEKVMKYVLATALAASWIATASAALARSYDFDCGEYRVHVSHYRDFKDPVEPVGYYAVTIDHISTDTPETPVFKWDVENLDDDASATLGGHPCKMEKE
jgi:hypothetical protein